MLQFESRAFPPARDSNCAWPGFDSLAQCGVSQCREAI
jgi:hypothetical protein